MTITDTKCTSFIIADQYFQDLIDDSPSPGYTLNLTIKLNDTEVLDEDLADTDVVGAIYTYATTDGGFYEVIITKTETVSGDVFVKQGCLFWDCDDVICDLVDHLSTTTVASDTNITLYYNALLGISTCVDCSCANARQVWTKMNNIISGNTTTDDCGCN